MSVQPSGEFLRRFALGECLGEGGTGAVYRARQLDLGREVAIKFLAARGRPTAEDRARFVSEGQALARLVHPHILRLYDLAFDEDRPYLVLELVVGRTLRRIYEDVEEDRAGVVDLLIPIASALGHAHGLGFVHRDVKPENILVDTEGHARLADFGLARLTGSRRLTKAGFVMGTLIYLPPEALTGEEVGPPGDVYALAVTLYEGLTGDVPFPEDDIEAQVRAKRRGEIPDPHRTNPRIVPGLCQVLRAALAADPRRRIPDGDALATELAGALGRPAPARASRQPSAPASGSGRTGVAGAGGSPERRALRAADLGSGAEAPTGGLRAARPWVLGRRGIAVGVALVAGLLGALVWVSRERATLATPISLTPLPLGAVVRVRTDAPARPMVEALDRQGRVVTRVAASESAREHALTLLGLAPGTSHDILVRIGGRQVGSLRDYTPAGGRLLGQRPAPVYTSVQSASAALELPAVAVLGPGADWPPGVTVSLRPPGPDGRRALVIAGPGLAFRGVSGQVSLQTPDGHREDVWVTLPPLATVLADYLTRTDVGRWLETLAVALERTPGPRRPDVWRSLRQRQPAPPPVLSDLDGIERALASPRVDLELRMRLYERLTDLERIDRLLTLHGVPPPHRLPDLYRALVPVRTERPARAGLPQGARVLVQIDTRENNVHVEGADLGAEEVAIKKVDPAKRVVAEQRFGADLGDEARAWVLGIDGRTIPAWTYLDVQVGQTLRLRAFGEGEGVVGIFDPMSLVSLADPMEFHRRVPYQRFLLTLPAGALPRGRTTIRITAHPLVPWLARKDVWIVPAVHGVYLLRVGGGG